MGLDLSLLPFTLYREVDAWSFAIIPLERRPDLFEKINEIKRSKGKSVPPSFDSHFGVEEGELGTSFGQTQEDAYGSQLKYIDVADLMALKDEEGVWDNWENRAAWMYLFQLPKNMKIALYWG